LQPLREEILPIRCAQDVVVVEAAGREFILVGTAHVAQESVALVSEVIRAEQPDGVCIELDPRRYETLVAQQQFEALDLREVIRRRQLATLLVNLVLVAYQRRLGGKLGVLPGAEFLEAARVAEECGIPIELCDRDVRTTLRRAWAATPFFKKLWLLSSVLATLFERLEVSEEALRELRRRDVVTGLLREIGESFPYLKKALIDERDAYLAEKIRRTPGRKLVAVVGAGHVEGIRRNLMEGREIALEPLETLPPESRLWRAASWGIPLLIVGSLLAIAVLKGPQVAGENLLFWVLINGIPSAIGAVIAWAHPATIVISFASAPWTSLTPLIGVGTVAAFLEAYLRPPLVREFSSVFSDITTLRGWWRSRLLRVLLVFLLTSVGGVAGAWIGGAKIIASLFR